MREAYGKLNGKGKKIGIVVAKFNELVTRKLLDGAKQGLEQLGVEANNIIVYWVPGAFEIPRVVKLLSNSGKVDGIISLGAVIRGETSHYDYVCNEVSSGISQVSLNNKVPVMFGILTADSMNQALDRAGGKSGNKGIECASGVIEMINLENELKLNK
ncbi:6,7-dimethyl-8-ribityllumazine synthase [Pediococcus acidilactici]|uniref:6,7-dimethyl-8-ribityllumazine synthase n=1 Tax=Pediococcus acidilactici TaxID=1254 RepID=UPI0008785518|nr:6,7-dimethyl-8-ribityllumazine synthase [Pediococcus acidilactici]AOW73807.1 6,7-dimethyl-8-ribityllumazine synthase [Pediococcus acidilactici]MCQ0050028.1 6,7-dimethyl-8-ribityllumazine synthase [Pediococcus acidilactici]MCQ0051838.1 6,7-dimethyl-8-ribityllumazine synthase [Pediococcus acidilactici]MCQ0053887.1 6,7-dimethyl-8-ribityllumazine synthase [Pediococcus acidilactici]MCQ0061348.1 6,7-dimethyl-8-ribityllumazine synthase [Pediococcus acidilactici]